MFKNRVIISLLAKSVGFAISLLIPIALGNGGITWIELFSVFSISLLSVFSGYQLAYKLGVSRSASFTAPFEIVIGFSVVSFLQLILTLIFKLNPIQAFLAVTALISGLALLDFKLSRVQKNDVLALNNIKSLPFDVGVLILISLLTTLWCRELITAVPQAKATGIFRGWVDIFLHATQIVSLQDYSILPQQSFYLSGTEQPVYHVASYVLSAFYASITNEPVLNVATYFWVPVGIVLMGIGVYGLGCALADRLAGFFAVAAIFLLPDASMYGLKNGFFGFHWLMQIAPGSGYAMGLVLMALALFIHGVRKDRFGLILWCLVIGLFSAAFRVQIAAPAAITLAILVFMCWRPTEVRHRMIALIVFCIAAALAVILFESIELAPHFISGKRHISSFFDFVHAQAITPYGDAYVNWTKDTFKPCKWVLEYGLLLIAALGLIFPAVLVWGVKKLASKEEYRINLIPFILMLSGFMVIVLIPVSPDGDFTNYGHRQFVLIYAVCLTFLMAWIRIFYQQLSIKYEVSKWAGFVMVAILALGGIAVPLGYGKSIQKSELKSDWGFTYTNTQIPNDLFKVASFIKEKSAISDIVLNSDLDSYATFVALTERRAYLSRDALYKQYKEKSGEIFKLRAIELERLKDIKNFVDLYSFASKNSIRWFIKHPYDMTSWPESLINCSVYESGGFRVYDLGSKDCVSGYNNK